MSKTLILTSTCPVLRPHLSTVSPPTVKCRIRTAQVIQQWIYFFIFDTTTHFGPQFSGRLPSPVCFSDTPSPSVGLTCHLRATSACLMEKESAVHDNRHTWANYQTPPPQLNPFSVHANDHLTLHSSLLFLPSVDPWQTQFNLKCVGDSGGGKSLISCTVNMLQYNTTILHACCFCAPGEEE